MNRQRHGFVCLQMCDFWAIQLPWSRLKQYLAVFHSVRHHIQGEVSFESTLSLQQNADYSNDLHGG
ncbi:MAG: hypothetical protein K2M82_03110 [Lachnospiraceae bacterium]|nr:hypothetical protein [Lachnospiraceae bacterium]